MLKKTPRNFLGGLVLFGLLLGCSPQANASVRFYDYEELGDKDLSPEGRLALHLDPDLEWHHTQTKHFSYHFTSTDPALEAYLADAEKYYNRIKTLFGVTHDDWQKSVHIFVFQKDWAWKKLMESLRQDPETPALTEGWDLFIRHAVDEKSRVQSLSHELGHIILFRFVDGRPPLFLNEGFAEYMSLMALADFLGVDPSRIRRSQKVTDADYISLSVLSALESYPEKEKAIFYHESEELTRYLIAQYGGDKFYLLMKELSHGKGFRETFRSVYNKGVEDIEPDFKKSLLEP